MQISVNGQATSLAERGTIGALLRELGLAPIRVAVERNEELVTRGEFDHAVLNAGDRLEIVTFVGGG